jgi:hypothetical protein
MELKEYFEDTEGSAILAKADSDDKVDGYLGSVTLGDAGLEDRRGRQID